MTREVLNNGETGLSFRNKLNSNFTQLYAGSVALPVSGRWVAACTGGVTLQAGQNSSASLWLYPFIITEATTISDLGMRVATASAGVNGMLGIYAHSTTTGDATGTAVASVVGISMAATGTVSGALASNVTLQPGLYWVAFQASGATAAATTAAASELALICMVSGSTSLSEVSTAAATAMQYKFVANTYGTFPDLTGASFSNSAARNGALLFYKVA